MDMNIISYSTEEPCAINVRSNGPEGPNEGNKGPEDPYGFDEKDSDEKDSDEKDE